MLKKPPAASIERKLFPASSDLDMCTPATKIVLSFDGSMRSWLKYSERALQLLTAVQVFPLLPERKIPVGWVPSAGGVRFVPTPAPAARPPPAAPAAPPRPPPKPRPGPALLHQSYAA